MSTKFNTPEDINGGYQIQKPFGLLDEHAVIFVSVLIYLFSLTICVAIPLETFHFKLGDNESVMYIALATVAASLGVYAYTGILRNIAVALSNQRVNYVPSDKHIKDATLRGVVTPWLIVGMIVFGAVIIGIVIALFILMIIIAAAGGSR